jgi:hypothetical protein
MADRTCKGCGGETNTALSDHAQHADLEPRKCYARWREQGGGWVRGCGIDELPEDSPARVFAEKIIAESEARWGREPTPAA